MINKRPSFSGNQYNDPTLPGYDPKRPTLSRQSQEIAYGYQKGRSVVYDPYCPDCRLNSKENILRVSVGIVDQYGKKITGDIFQCTECGYEATYDTKSGWIKLHEEQKPTINLDLDSTISKIRANFTSIIVGYEDIKEFIILAIKAKLKDKKKNSHLAIWRAIY